MQDRKLFKINNVMIELVEGDITELEVDAIVNAANRYLKHGGGVALAIVRKGGEVIQKESDEYVKKHGPLPVGGVAVTSAGNLKAKYVIHTVGPRYGDPSGDEKLAKAISNSILKADELGLKSVALPAISTGVYGYPLELCARIMADTIMEIAPRLKSLEKIVVCLYGKEAYNIFANVFKEKLAGYIIK